MNMEAAASTVTETATATAVEAAHWEPPMAPVDMPRQVLERTARAESHGLLPRLAAFLRLA